MSTIPSESECLRILRDAGCKRRVIVHCCTVRTVAEEMMKKIDCDRDFYRNATADSRVLILAVSKKNEDQMIGFDPSTYDKDGIF